VADSIFTVVAGGSISVLTSSASKIKNYNLRLDGTITGYTASNSVSFTVNVKDYCSTATITSATISNLIYDIKVGALVTVTNPLWTVSELTCPSITYSLLDTSTNTAPDSIFVLTSSTGLVTIYTSDYI
jgi:hypothetical protein